MANSSNQTPELIIREHDVIAVIGRQELHTRRSDAIGPEVSDKELLDSQ